MRECISDGHFLREDQRCGSKYCACKRGCPNTRCPICGPLTKTTQKDVSLPRSRSKQALSGQGSGGTTSSGQSPSSQLLGGDFFDTQAASRLALAGQGHGSREPSHGGRPQPGGNGDSTSAGQASGSAFASRSTLV